MAYKIQYMLLCDSVQEVGRGKLNILGTFDQVYLREVPARWPQLVAVVLFSPETEDELGDHAIVFRIVDPKGRPFQEQGTNVKVVPGPGSWPLASVRLVVGISNIPFTQYGRHWLQILVDGNILGQHPLTVAPPPAGHPAA